MRVTSGTIDYICRDMLHLGLWRPDMGDCREDTDVLSACDSLLEVMYVIGAYHYLERVAARVFGAALPPAFGLHIGIGTDEAQYPAIWFMEPWFGFGAGGGPSALALIPQYPIGTLHADFAVAYGDDNGSPQWTIGAIIEIDGYGVHRTQRERDAHRAAYIEGVCKVPVLRFFEESHDPLTWFQYVVEHFHDRPSVQEVG